MADPFLGEIRVFAGNYAPQGWALCQGQTLSIAQNTALFSLLGTTYGGDGIQTFQLPDLRGRIVVGPGQGPGLSPYVEGQIGGQETVTMTMSQMPVHNHFVHGSSGSATQASASGGYLPSNSGKGAVNLYAATSPSPQPQLANDVISMSGGSQPVDVRSPYVSIYFIIAMQGIYPPRS